MMIVLLKHIYFFKWVVTADEEPCGLQKRGHRRGSTANRKNAKAGEVLGKDFERNYQSGHRKRQSDGKCIELGTQRNTRHEENNATDTGIARKTAR